VAFKTRGKEKRRKNASYRRGKGPNYPNKPEGGRASPFSTGGETKRDYLLATQTSRRKRNYRKKKEKTKRGDEATPPFLKKMEKKAVHRPGRKPHHNKGLQKKGKRKPTYIVKEGPKYLP